jgi:transposase
MTPDKKDAIVRLHRSGMRKKEIDDSLGINYSTVLKFLKRFQQTNSVENVPRSGRPKKMDDRRCRVLNHILREDKSATLVDITNKFNTNSHK